MATTRSRRAYQEMKQYHRIEGDIVLTVTETVTKSTKLDDLLATWSTLGETTTPILPIGCRFYKKKEDITVFVIEQPPQIRHISWRDMDRNTPDKVLWKLAFPYVVFVMEFVGDATNYCRIYYRTAPLATPTDSLYKVNLCNVYANDAICTGAMEVRTRGSMVQKAEAYVSAFWHAPFNVDLIGDHFRPTARLVPQVATLAEWEKQTLENSLFPLAIDKWQPVDLDLSKIVEKITNRENF